MSTLANETLAPFSRAEWQQFIGDLRAAMGLLPTDDVNLVEEAEKRQHRLSVRANQVRDLRRSLKQLQRAYDRVAAHNGNLISRNVALNDTNVRLAHMPQPAPPSQKHPLEISTIKSDLIVDSAPLSNGER